MSMSNDNYNNINNWNTAQRDNTTRTDLLCAKKILLTGNLEQRHNKMKQTIMN